MKCWSPWRAVQNALRGWLMNGVSWRSRRVNRLRYSVTGVTLAIGVYPLEGLPAIRIWSPSLWHNDPNKGYLVRASRRLLVSRCTGEPLARPTN